MHKIPEEFRSKLFVKLFLSYVIIIAVFMCLYMGSYMYSYSARYNEALSADLQRQADAWAAQMDQQLLSAQSLCAAVNTSESCRSTLQTMYVEHKVIDPMQLYRMLNELRRIKGASGNINVYNILLAFHGDTRAYSAGAVISLSEQSGIPAKMPFIGETTANALLGVQCNSSQMFNKEYLIYADAYNAMSTTGAKGTVMVLLEKSGLQKLVRSALSGVAGSAMTLGEKTMLQTGEVTELTFCAESLVVNGLVYHTYVHPSVMHPRLHMGDLWPALLAALLGLVFIAITYHLSKQYYKPINHIGKIIDHTSSENEVEDILDGIRNLIGERNSYRDRMLVISPYVQQGMLQSILTGSELSSDLAGEQYVSLREAYFMLALVNISGQPGRETPEYNDAQKAIRRICAEMSGADVTVLCCRRNVQEIYVIFNSDDECALEDHVYELHTRIENALVDDRFVITIGVSRVESDMESLREACRDAETALEQMLTGGRGSVYFAEAEGGLQERAYFFPKDAQASLIKWLKEGDQESFRAMLDDLYERNIVQSDLALSEVRAMVDELHLNMRSALRAVCDVRTVHIELERIHGAATIEEVFSYYRHVFETALQNVGELVVLDGQENMEEKVCAYIDAHFGDPMLSLSSVAEEFGVSTKVVGLICKKVYGKTFLQYVRSRQVEYAIELLETTDDTLEDIAKKCGFSNLLTFRRNFKAAMNMNPRDFRK